MCSTDVLCEIPVSVSSHNFGKKLQSILATFSSAIFGVLCEIKPTGIETSAIVECIFNAHLFIHSLL